MRKSNQSKDGVVVSSVRSKKSSVISDSRSNSGWNFKQSRASDTGILRYDRVAMLEAVLSIRDRRLQVIRWIIVATLLIAGGFIVAAGILGWLS